jgi:hypothetical protein
MCLHGHIPRQGKPRQKFYSMKKQKPLGRYKLPNGQVHQPSSLMEVNTMTIAQIDKPYQVITDRILALLEQGAVPWQQPWDSVTGGRVPAPCG